jgi:hypothetical protein
MCAWQCLDEGCSESCVLYYFKIPKKDRNENKKEILIQQEIPASIIDNLSEAIFRAESERILVLHLIIC